MDDGVAIANVAKSFGATRVLNGVSLDIRQGEFVSLVGASGCGKSTLLRIIAGLETQDSGSISIGGRPVDHLRPRDRNVAMVFQSYALYPHMTVADNIAMPLTMARLSLAQRLPLVRLFLSRRRPILRQIRSEAAQVAAQLQIEQLLDRKPAQLLGGQRQRVALARAMVRHPAVFLMDEPLSNLDAKLRVHMRGELADLHRRLGVTFIYVTHDQIEAMTMSDRVALMDSGSIVQLGTPAELYDRPRSLKVAQFIGSPAINILAVETDRSGGLTVADTQLPLIARALSRATSLGIRSEALTPLIDPCPEGSIALRGRLRRVEHYGSEHMLHITLDSGSSVVCRITPTNSFDPSLGAVVNLAFRLDQAHFFGADGERLKLDLPAPQPVRMQA